MSSNPDFSDIHIESTLPKPWEEEQSFNDILYDWMSKAPWLLISALAHVLIFFILAAIPWDELRKKDELIMQAQLEVPQDDPFEEIEEEEEEIEEEETIEEPVLKDAEISDHNEEETDQDFEATEGDPDFLADSPFDDSAFNDVIGVGGGAGGKFGGRFGGRRNLKAAGGKGTEQALKDGLEWLKHHQSPDGSWEAQGFSANCGKIGSSVCDGEGSAVHDVGITALALLAFMGDGHVTSQPGEYQETVKKGIAWLKGQQDSDNGLIGDRASHEFLYNHAIATLALCEDYYFSKSPVMKGPCQKAVYFIQNARNPYSAWRYEAPPNGESDSSVTGWMIFALTSADEAKLRVDKGAFEGGLSFLEEATGPDGRVGYREVGESSSRIPGINDQYPRDKTETLTSVGVLSRIFRKQDPKDFPEMVKGADLMLKALPEWDPEGLTNDMYYWYYGTYAMFQLSAHKQYSKYWTGWNDAMKKAILPNQVKEADAKGSWDPIGPWGHAGGRVYSTALMVLCLEVYFRYAQVLGAR